MLVIDHDDNQVESLQADVESLRKENERLRSMLEVVSNKCKILEAQYLQKRSLDITNKRARTDHDDQFPLSNNKTSKLYFKTDPKSSKDKNLVSNIYFYFSFIYFFIFLLWLMDLNYLGLPTLKFAWCWLPIWLNLEAVIF